MGLGFRPSLKPLCLKPIIRQKATASASLISNKSPPPSRVSVGGVGSSGENEKKEDAPGPGIVRRRIHLKMNFLGSVVHFLLLALTCLRCALSGEAHARGASSPCGGGRCTECHSTHAIVVGARQAHVTTSSQCGGGRCSAKT